MPARTLRFHTFPRAFLLTAALVGSTIASSQSAAAMTYLGGYGPWLAFAGGTTNGPFCGMRTAMTGGGALALTVDAGGVHLIASDPHWRMDPGDAVPIQVTMNGNSFSGDGTVSSDGRGIIVRRLPGRFLADFINGYGARFRFGGVNWDIDLTGTEATGALVYRCARGIGL